VVNLPDFRRKWTVTSMCALPYPGLRGTFEEACMYWIIFGVAAIGVFAFFEWRSRNKPLPPGLQNHWSVHSAATNGEGRTLTGGHDNNHPD
jgi:hypothetical protein